VFDVAGIGVGCSGWHMRPVELFEGRLLLVDKFAGFASVKVETADTDWRKPFVVRFEKQWVLVDVLVVAAAISSYRILEGHLC